MIDYKLSQRIKAVSILMVIASHMHYYFEMNAYLCSILGMGGVACFLILSGYGVTSSFLNKGITGDYWGNKVKKVLCPYWTVTLIWIVLKRIYKVVNSEIILKNMLLIDYERNIDGSMWYLSFLILWYILFFLIFKLDYSIILKLALLFSFAYWFYENPSDLFGQCAWQFQRNAFCFPIGVLLAVVSKQYKGHEIKFYNDKLLLVIKACALVFSFIMIRKYYILQTDDIYPCQINSIFVFILVAMICSIIGQFSFISQAFDKVGSISYFLYLIEGKWFILVEMLGITSFIGNFTVYILTITVAGVIYYILTNKKDKIKFLFPKKL